MLSVNELKRKQDLEQQRQANPVKTYVDHFSHVADVFSVESKTGAHNAGFDFASMMKDKINKHTKPVMSIQDKVNRMMKTTDDKRQAWKNSGTEVKISMFRRVERPSIYQKQAEQEK